MAPRAGRPSFSGPEPHLFSHTPHSLPWTRGPWAASSAHTCCKAYFSPAPWSPLKCSSRDLGPSLLAPCSRWPSAAAGDPRAGVPGLHRSSAQKPRCRAPSWWRARAAPILCGRGSRVPGTPGFLPGARVSYEGPRVLAASPSAGPIHTGWLIWGTAVLFCGRGAGPGDPGQQSNRHMGRTTCSLQVMVHGFGSPS